MPSFLLHLPFVAPAQVAPDGQLDVAQQAPSTQLPVEQALATVQVAPKPSSATQTLELQ